MKLTLKTKSWLVSDRFLFTLISFVSAVFYGLIVFSPYVSILVAIVAWITYTIFQKDRNMLLLKEVIEVSVATVFAFSLILWIFILLITSIVHNEFRLFASPANFVFIGVIFGISIIPAIPATFLFLFVRKFFAEKIISKNTEDPS